MLESQRLAALAVGQVLDGRSLTEALGTLFAGAPRLTPPQRGAVQDLAYGALRHLGTLQAVLDQLVKTRPADPRVTWLLLVALYQLEFRRTPPHAVVNEAVAAAAALSLRAPKALVNAVLRNFLRRREPLLTRAQESEEGRFSHPRWWIERLRRDYPDRYAVILEAGNGRPPMTLRVNRRRTDIAAYLALLAEWGMSAERIGDCAVLLARPVPVERLPGFAEGLVSVQDLGAQQAAALLELADGQRVLDACAAPGGKTAHILERADLDCLALDNDPARLERVRSNLDRLGLRARLLAADAASLDWWDGVPFDRILADVPCSASGIVRRHPDIKWLRRETDIAQYAAAQRRILDALWQTLARDGKLLYATCSVFGEENRLQIASFLQRHPDAQLLPLAGAPAPDDGQLLPGPHHDGFFYALLGKRPA